MNGKTRRFLSVGTALGLLASAGSAAFLGSRLIQPAKAAAPYDFVGDTLTFSQQGLTNEVRYTDSFTNGSVSVTFTGGANDGKYYNTGSGIRTYGGGSIHVCVEDKGLVLTKVIFTWSGSGNAPTDGNVVSVGSYNSNTYTWAGSTDNLVLTRPNGSGHWRLQSLTFTTESLSSFAVRYDGNGGTGSVKDDTEYQSGGQVTVKDNAFTRGEYASFSQWNTKADGSGTAYAPGATFNITGNTTLYAIWNFDETELSDGSYSATLRYANPIPSFAYVESNSVAKAELEIAHQGISYDDTHDEYEFLSQTGSITFTNHTNAAFTKVVVNVYNYDNYTIYADGVSVHEGDYKSGHDKIELDVEASSTIVIQNTSTYPSKIKGVELFMRVGNEKIHPTDVELNAASGDIFIGKSRQLTATVLPLDADDRSVTWSTSDHNIATVDENGLVTGVAAGNVTITVTTSDGGLEASFTGTVKSISYGTLEEPLTVEQAYEVLATESPTAQALFVKGRVTNSTYYSGKSSSYTIWLESSDGTNPHYFELYHTKLRSAIDEGVFTALDALAGMKVIASGLAKMYNGTPELADFNENYPYVEAIEMSAEQFANAILSDTQPICDEYPYTSEVSSEHRDELSLVWWHLSVKYRCVSEEEKEILINATADQSGTIIEKAVARYDFITAKYDLDPVIIGRAPISLAQNVYTPFSGGTAIWAIALVAGVSVGALAIGTFVAFRKKKQN